MLTSMLLKGDDVRKVLKAIIAADLPARGLAHVISVREIAATLGPRWAARQEAVWEFLERAVHRRGDGVFAVRLNDVDVLLAFAEGEPAAAAARCHDILGDVLQHFLGRSGDLRRWIHPIPSIEAMLEPQGGGDPEPLSAVESATRPADVVREPVLARAPSPARAAAGDRFDTVGWTASDGERRFVAVALRPVWSLRHEAVSSFRLYRGLSPPELGYGPERQRLDLAVLRHAAGPEALGLLDQGTFLHLPVALGTLLMQRSRLQYLAIVKEAQSIFRRRVLLELEAVDTGVVESRLQEVVHIVRPFFRVVLASSTGRPVSGRVLRATGIAGAVIDLAAIEEPLTRRRLLARIEPARRDFNVVVVHGLMDGEVEDEMLTRAGATHVSTRPGEPRDQVGLEEFAIARRAEATELRRVASLIKF